MVFHIWNINTGSPVGEQVFKMATRNRYFKLFSFYCPGKTLSVEFRSEFIDILDNVGSMRAVPCNLKLHYSLYIFNIVSNIVKLILLLKTSNDPLFE